MSNIDPATTTAVDRSPLRILGLKVSNYKRVVVVELHPDGRSVLVGGRNAQGKSSLLDAIADTLGGAKRGSGTELALRTGSMKGETRVDLGEIIVTRTWTPSGDKLVVESPPGSPLKSPQAVLDKLVGDLSFDPLGFARLNSKAQAETLRRLSGLDTRAIDERRTAAFTERTGINGQLKRAKAVRDEQVVPPEPTAPPAKPSVTGLIEEQERLRARGSELATLTSAPGSLEVAIESVTREIAQRERIVSEQDERAMGAHAMLLHLGAVNEAAKLAKDAAPEGLADVADLLTRQVEDKIVSARRFMEAAVSARDTADRERDERQQIKAQAEGELEGARQEAAAAANETARIDARLAEIKVALKDADAATTRHEAGKRLVDEHARALAEWKRRDAEVARLDGDAEHLTAIIAGADEEKLRAIGAARFPIEGLGIDGDVVTYRGVPFAQASQAQRVLVGFAIGAALNPTLRVILIREGALLDDESLAAILAAAAARGFQVWVETVGQRDTGAPESVGVILEDGRLSATHGALDGAKK
jgi:hypothetical protein